MLGPAYQTRDMKMCQELALHPWIHLWIVGGGTVHFEVRAIFSTLQEPWIRQMDCSTKMIEDGVVDSPPNRNAQPVIVSSPLPLRTKSMTPACIRGSFGDSRSSCKFYDIPSSFLPCGVVKVFSKTFIGVWYFSCYLMTCTCIEDWVLLTHTSLNRISQHCRSGLLLLSVFC
jgi:hypothetical protein